MLSWGRPADPELCGGGILPPPEPVARWVLSLAVAVNFGVAAVAAAVMIIVVPDVLRVMGGLSAVVLTWVGWRRLRTTPNR